MKRVLVMKLFYLMRKSQIFMRNVLMMPQRVLFLMFTRHKDSFLRKKNLHLRILMVLRAELENWFHWKYLLRSILIRRREKRGTGSALILSVHAEEHI